MSKNKGASRFKPRYDCFERSRDSPYTASVTDRTSQEVRDDPLSGYKAWPAGQKRKDPEFVEMNKTLRTTAEECLAEFRYNFISVTLDRVAHNEKENETLLEDMFADDPLGLKTVPVNNPDSNTGHTPRPCGHEARMQSGCNLGCKVQVPERWL